MAEMILRDAHLGDVAALVQHGGSFLQSVAPGYTLDRDGLARDLATLIASPDGFVLVAERDERVVGAMIAMACKPIMAVERAAREIAWWIEPQARGSRTAFAMIARFEAFAAERGCKSAVMVTLPALSPPGLKSYLARRGYVTSEEAHVRPVA